jgi:hypothetical protein
MSEVPTIVEAPAPVADRTEVRATGLRRPIPLVTDYDADPLAGIPSALHDAVGCYDSDTAGGCG